MRKEAMLYEKLDNDIVHCFLCNHHCKIADNKFGFCMVRQNAGGKLYSLVYGEAAAVNIDPVEKKPLYHFLPGTSSYSIATIGCNFRCGFCQNWQISQVSKKENPNFSADELLPEQVVKNAEDAGCRSISYTYTEPTIFFEYAFDCAKLAKKQGLKNIFVTNGFMTKEAIDMISPYLDAANVDIKSFSEDFYKRVCKASLAPVLDGVRYMRKLGIWVEITTLVIPGENDSYDELKQIASFITGVDKDMPWHISRFHPDYQFSNYPPTSLETLQKAKDIGCKAGLRYIYLGNVLEGTDTYCYNCKKLLVKRNHYNVDEISADKNKCPFCNAAIEGVWQ